MTHLANLKANFITEIWGYRSSNTNAPLVPLEKRIRWQRGQTNSSHKRELSAFFTLGTVSLWKLTEIGCSLLCDFGRVRRLADKRKDSHFAGSVLSKVKCTVAMRSSPWYTDPLENNNAETTFVLKRVQRENPLLLVILRNIRFSFHLAMLEKSRRRARALAKTRVDKPSWVKRSKEIGVFVLGRKGGGLLRLRAPADSPGEMNTEMVVTHPIPTVPFHPTKSRLWTGER